MFLLRREPNEAVPSSLSGNKAFRVEHGFHGAVESFPAALLQFITVFIRQCLLSDTRRCGCSRNCFDARASFRRLSSPTN
jgi:hypothetical protein